MSLTFHCPDVATHEADDVDAARHSSVDAAVRVVALLSERCCPACPKEHTTTEDITLFGTVRQALRCTCCGALWLLDGTEYICLDRGRLLTVAATDPVGLAEIADRLGVARQTVDNWRTKGVLPEPKWTVGGRPAWEWADIVAWRG